MAYKNLIPINQKLIACLDIKLGQHIAKKGTHVFVVDAFTENGFVWVGIRYGLSVIECGFKLKASSRFSLRKALKYLFVPKGVENSGASNYVTIFKDGEENKVLISHNQPKK